MLKGILDAIIRRRTQRRTKEQTIIYKTLHGKLKIEQHEPH